MREIDSSKNSESLLFFMLDLEKTSFFTKKNQTNNNINLKFYKYRVHVRFPFKRFFINANYQDLEAVRI